VSNWIGAAEMSIDNQIEAAKYTIESAGLKCVIKKSNYRKAGEPKSSRGTGITLSINIANGVRPVSVWPIQGTVFSSKQKIKQPDGSIKSFKCFRSKGLSFESSIYLAVQIALEPPK
jgi:hypothetical protein